MKIDKILMDMMRGEWLISFNGIQAYAPIVHKILMGEAMKLEQSTDAIFKILDDNGKRVLANSDGEINIPKGSVAIVDMIGPVMKYGDWCNHGADDIVAALRFADKNPNIVGTVFNIDSPGGSVSAIGPFIEFAKTKTKRIEAIADQCCSLGYWAACAVGDFISADNNISAAFGSVGVVSTFTDNRKYLETLGYTFHEIYADESEHKNLAFQLALDGKYEMIKKEMLSPLAVKFQNGVRENRPNLKEEIGVLTGKTFGADIALQYGMIDATGSLDQAINRLHIKSELNHYK